MRDDNNDIVIPLAVGAAGGGFLLWKLLRRQAAVPDELDASPTTTSKPAPKPPSGAAWRWPVPLWGDYSPVISDGWGSNRRTLDGKPRMHVGADLMFPRRSLTDQATEFPANTPGGSKWHFMPADVPALAAAAGRVVYAERTPRGHAVRIDHGGWSTFYQHLSALKVSKGQTVELGAELGPIGGDPTQSNPLRHLHFELWHGKKADAIDPKPALLAWQRVRLYELPGGMQYAITLPPPKHLA